MKILTNINNISNINIINKNNSLFPNYDIYLDYFNIPELSKIINIYDKNNIYQISNIAKRNPNTIDFEKKIYCFNIYKNNFLYIDDNILVNNIEKILEFKNNLFLLKLNNLNNIEKYKKIIEICKKSNILTNLFFDIDENNINYDIFNFSILGCKSEEFINILTKYINEYYYQSFFIENYILDNKCNSEEIYNLFKKYFIDIFISTIIFKNKFSVDFITENDIKYDEFDKNVCINYFINNKFEEINDSFTFQKIFDMFINEDPKIKNYTILDKIFEEFLKEKNASGGCSSCKLKLLRRKYHSLIFQAIFENIK